MSVPKQKQNRTFFDVAYQVEPLFRDAKDRYRLFHENVLPALRKARGELVTMYCRENGRPAIEPVIMMGATLLQFMEKVPDRAAAEMIKLHLGWKYALDVELDYEGFHPTSLVHFRERLISGEKTRAIFDTVLDVLRENQMMRKGRKQRLDSTHVLGSVARMSRLEMIRETIRLLLEYLQKAKTGREMVDWELLVERYCDSEIAWRNQTREQLNEKYRRAGEDARGLICWLRMQPSVIRDSEKAILLERVFLEQYEISEGKALRRKSEKSGVVKNPHDPDVQWATKDPAKKKQWEGYKVQIAETVADDGKAKPQGEPTEQFITEATTTEAIASDLDGHRRVEANQRRNGQETAAELYVDAAYVTDDTLAKAHEKGRELVGPARPSPKHLGGFPSDEFDVAVANREAVCPAGKPSTQCSRLKNQRTGQVDYRFEWGNQCDGCALQKKCTKSRSGRRMLVVGEHHDLLQQRRREMQTEAFKKRMQQRNGIELKERSVSLLGRGGDELGTEACLKPASQITALQRE